MASSSRFIRKYTQPRLSVMKPSPGLRERAFLIMASASSSRIPRSAQLYPMKLRASGLSGSRFRISSISRMPSSGRPILS